jgi:uncharacterized membrane protein (DUF4010 family)
MGDLAKMMTGGRKGPGVTTEVAILVVFTMGCLLATHVTEAVICGGAVAILLHYKGPLHRFVERLGADDLRAVIRLALLGLVILPALPDRPWGPYGVLNPFRIWLMVVLIVGISLGAYVAYRLLGARRGSILGGILGGLISSTATTVSNARRAKEEPAESGTAAAVIAIASCVVFGRVLLEVGLVAPRIFGTVAPPLAAMMTLMAVLAAVAFRLGTGGGAGAPDPKPPTELKPAILFGLLYAVVLLLVAFARERFGHGGLYAVAGLSGLTDMDAITLSTAELAGQSALDERTAWRVILVSSMANVAFKGLVVAVLGSPQLRARVGALFAVALAGGGAILWLWP